MPTRTPTPRPRRIYLREWRDLRRLTQAQLGDKLDVSDVTVHRWEKGQSLLNTNVMAAVADALGIEPWDLFRHPAAPSADSLLHDATPEVRAAAIAYIQFLRAQQTPR